MTNKMNFKPKTPEDIINLLDSIGKYSKKSAKPLPLKEKVENAWSGIGFRIGKHRFVVPLEEVKEIMSYPSLSIIPGSKAWAKGIANIRGNLLPIFDLNSFLEDNITKVSRKTRVMTISTENTRSGFVVDEILGMKYFDRTTFNPGIKIKSDWEKFQSGGYENEGENWVVFDLIKVVKDEKFSQVAA